MINAAWIFPDEEYVRHFSDYLAEHPHERLRIHFFTSAEAYGEAHRRSFELIAVAERWMTHPSLPEAGKLLCLTEQGSGGHALNPYQPIPMLLHELERAASPSGAKTREKREGAVVRAVYSASGGAGKTVVARYLAGMCARQGRRVLYIPLEMASGESSEEIEGMSDLMFYVRDGVDPSEAKQRWAHRASAGYDEIMPFRHPLDAAAMSAEDVERIVALYAQDYDDLVLDLDTELSGRTSGALGLSRDILWIVPQGALHFRRAGRILSSLNEPWTGRVRMIVNKVVQAPLQRGERDSLAAIERMPIAARLPYIPAWKQANEYAEMMQDDAFRAALEPAVSVPESAWKEAAG